MEIQEETQVQRKTRDTCTEENNKYRNPRRDKSTEENKDNNSLFKSSRANNND